MISLYSGHGKHKRLFKFKSYYKAAKFIDKNFTEKQLKDENYFLKETKS